MGSARQGDISVHIHVPKGGLHMSRMLALAWALAAFALAAGSASAPATGQLAAAGAAALRAI
jgi:hypothetical protein